MLFRLGLITLLFFAFAQAASAATCNFATSKGPGTSIPDDWDTYCWLDLSSFNSTQARSAGGQQFIFNLPNGGTLSFDLTVTGGGNGDLVATTLPTWTGGVLGNAAFIGVGGSPALYQATNGASNTVTLSNIHVSVGASNLPYTFVAADSESTNGGESLVFTTAGTPWVFFHVGGDNADHHTLSNGGLTLTIGGTGNPPAYFLLSDFDASNNVATITSVINGSGLQGIAFAVKYLIADLSIQSSPDQTSVPVGGQISYTLTVTNNGPDDSSRSPSDPPTRVTYTLDNGLSYDPTGSGGSGWSCSASGQVVTCESTATITSGNNYPVITINTDVASNPANVGTSVSNTAVISNNIYDIFTANNTATDSVNITHTSLTTSTKTVADTNGGDLMPGDTLQYTITLIESNGLDATGISVVDNMPASIQAGSLSITATPSGSTDSSNPGGGTNSTGQVNISNITVQANSSETIIYTVVVSPAAPQGQTIINAVTITNNDDPNGGVPPAGSPNASINVFQPQPSSGNKILYVYNNDTLTRTPQSTGGTDITISQNGTHSWALTPVLAKDLTIAANSTISVNLLVKCGQAGGGGCFGAPTWEASLYDNTVSAGTQVGATSPPASFDHANYTVETANINVGGSDVTIPAGHQLILRITNTINFNFGRYDDLDIEQYSGGNRSTINMDVSTVINVDSVLPYTASAPGGTQVNEYKPGGTVYLRAVVSDPFGSYDINPATGGVAPTITIKDASGAFVDLNGGAPGNAADITTVAATTAASKTFEYAYQVPDATTTPPLGYWTANVTATEGNASIDFLYNGGNTITHNTNGSFAVYAPDPVLSKSVQVLSDPTGSSTPHALPGAIVEYTILVSNTGLAETDNGSLDISDVIGADIAFVVGSVTFTDGSPTSGLNFSASSIQYCNGGTPPCTYTPVGTTDPNVTQIIITPSGTFTGKANSTAPAPNFTIKYQVELQ